MKKLMFLFIALLAVVVIPFGVYADEEYSEEYTEESTEVVEEQSREAKIYFFRGEGCSHCAEAEEWFKEIEEEYGSKFEIVDYETWYNEDNAELMQAAAEARGESADGVPYIIVGNKSWNGFADDYKQEILDQINAVYEQEVADRYDIIELIDKGNVGKKDDDKDSNGSSIAALILILLVAGVIGFGIYKTRETVTE